jgi:hypothetical protein
VAALDFRWLHRLPPYLLPRQERKTWIPDGVSELTLPYACIFPCVKEKFYLFNSAQGLAAILRILLKLFSCYAWVFCALHRLSTRRQHFTPSRTLPSRGRAGWEGAIQPGVY